MRGPGLEEIEALYRSRYASFVRVATGIVADDELAADAVHDGFVRAVRYRRRCRGSLEGWVWKIVVNEARKARGRAPLEPPAEPGSRSNGDEPDGRVRALVAALPERQRLALFLRYYADLDYAAIAAALDVAPGTVAATLNAAHAALRQELQEVDRCEI